MIRSKPVAPRAPGIWARIRKEHIASAALLFAAALLVSRVSVFGQIAPLGPAFAAAAFAVGMEPYAIGTGCLIGSVTLASTLPGALAATLAVVCIGGVLRWKQRNAGAKRMFTMLVCVMVGTELIFRTMLTFDLIMALLEATCAAVMYLVFYTAGAVAQGKRRKGVLSEEELVCIALTLCTLLLGGAPLHVAWFWPTAALAVLITLACAYWGSSGTGAAVGLACGLAVSLTGQVNVLFIGNMGAIGLVAGLLRRYKKPGIIGGAVLANALVTLYANGSSFVVISFADVALAGILLLLLPRAYLDAVGKNIDFVLQREASERHYLEAVRISVLEHLHAMAALFSRMGRTLADSSRSGTEVLAAQMEGASRMMGLMARSFDVQVRIEKDLEGSVRTHLETEGFRVREVVVAQKMFGALRVQISLAGCSMRSGCDGRITRAVSLGAMAPMRITARSCPGAGGKACSLTLEELPALAVQAGKAQSALDEVSGDSVACAKLGTGKFMICISDGMGSGEQAHAQSAATVELLENYFRAGLDKGTIFKSLNQIMLLRGEEMFSTVDLSLIDLLQGKAEFIKIGAAPTLLRRAGEYECLYASTLPMGILDQVSIQSTTRAVAHDDVIVMMSDGVSDALGDSLREVVEFILASKHVKPGKTARMIREAAAAALDGEERDDMTVVVAHVVKNAV